MLGAHCIAHSSVVPAADAFRADHHKALGLTIRPSILSRADEVIEEDVPPCPFGVEAV